MAIRVLRLGSERLPNEGLRIGTVRHPPRGVPKSEFSSGNWYDVWFPLLAPSDEAVKLAHKAGSPGEWTAFFRKYKSEMSSPDARHAIELLAALSKASDFSIGCYCEREEQCHRSALRELLIENGALMTEKCDI